MKGNEKKLKECYFCKEDRNINQFCNFILKGGHVLHMCVNCCDIITLYELEKITFEKEMQGIYD